MKSKATSSEIESNGKYVVQKSILRNEYKYFWLILFVVDYIGVGRKILPINIINILIQISNVNKYIKYLDDEGPALKPLKSGK